MARHNWLILRINRQEIERIAPYCRGELLDIGCGDKPYEDLLRPYVTRYVGLEHSETRHPTHRVDVWGSATCLPFDDGSFDTVVAFQVLEHVEEPSAMLLEVTRVFRPRGILILTTPFMWGIHEAPRDFFRYSKYGLQYLLEQAGFDDIQIKASSGFWVMASLRLSYYLNRLARGPVSHFIVAAQTAVQVVGMLLDKLDRVEEDTAGYVTVGRRRDS